MPEVFKSCMSLTTWLLSSQMTAHEVTLSLSLGALCNISLPGMTITMDERYSVSSGCGKSRSDTQSRPPSLWFIYPDADLWFNLARWECPLTLALCSWVSPSHGPHCLFTCLAYFPCAESQNKILSSACLLCNGWSQGQTFVLCFFTVIFDNGSKLNHDIFHSGLYFS